VRRVMGRQSLVRCLPLLLLLVVAVGVSGAGPAAADHDGAGDVYGVQVDPDNVLLQTHVYANGTGAWRVEYRIRLDDENTTAAFERHREEIEADPDRYESRFATDMQATIENAENTTDRSMSLSNVSVDVARERLPQRYGIIIYTFRWHGYARTNASSIVVGDAVRGIFLDSETTFLTTWPTPYNRVTAAPAPTETRANGIVWEGPMHFTADEPHLVVAETASPTDGTADGPSAPDPVPGEGPAAWVWVVAALVIVAVAAAVAVSVDAVPWPVGGEEGPGDRALLSNEEQVQAVLEEHGGRLKQQEVAAKLDWTDAKTSKVIRQMRDADAIETFRIGRENVVTLPDTDPADPDS